ncbi:hypothetical protein [Pseudozobellia thermophila]|uniref:Uncharacterized protein n=1 Tax=Pseudozobellia thermophila TaxID=192903 RepID=A0A1M6EXW4_9FLAO|nr:hypothetical protein [Pseudozobellia thermophila]SHI90246.1 hypothetical protein SAMN04488513_102219 [Pseudozobellia thermophila]
MLRKLVDYKKLDHSLATLLIETYPDGYGDDDIIVFKNTKGETVEAVELRTDDTIYLVKISKSLADFISNFEDHMDKELDVEPESVLEESQSQKFDVELERDMELEDDME